MSLSLPVKYKGIYVGECFAGIVVEDVLVVEIKCADRLTNEHMAQRLNYLRASGRTLCLLINFQKPKVEWKRIVQQLQLAQPDTHTSHQSQSIAALDHTWPHPIVE